FFELQYHGIVVQAVGLTFGTLLCMLVAYRTGLIRVTDKFRLGVVAATGAIALLYLVSFVLSFFHVSVPFVFGGGTAGIVVSLVIVGVAALNLVLDFDFIEQAAKAGAPKYIEWYAAFGLMVTLVWLYLELLRLLGNLRRR
ncbi:MAG TPA: Bax inhibitor-1/YccA family protein, partial [Gemmatimonadales bacterium]|nr:Bax inhibitor-1/YccA family protein [Gemmatimonadales bacterium]